MRGRPWCSSLERMTSSEQPEQGTSTSAESDAASQVDLGQPAKKHGDPLLDEAGAGPAAEGAGGSSGAESS